MAQLESVPYSTEHDNMTFLLLLLRGPRELSVHGNPRIRGECTLIVIVSLFVRPSALCSL